MIKWIAKILLYITRTHSLCLKRTKAEKSFALYSLITQMNEFYIIFFLKIHDRALQTTTKVLLGGRIWDHLGGPFEINFRDNPQPINGIYFQVKCLAERALLLLHTRITFGSGSKTSFAFPYKRERNTQQHLSTHRHMVYLLTSITYKVYGFLWLVGLKTWWFSNRRGS